MPSLKEQNQLITTEAAMIHPQLDFRTPKKVGFGAVGGGSSHYFWVLEILQELTGRGHEATLFTRSDSLRFANDYQGIQTHSVGGDFNFVASQDNATVKVHMQHRPPNPDRFIRRVMPSLLSNYSDEYLEFERTIKNNKMDIMLCDIFALACIDAATKANIPLITTSTMTYSQDSRPSYISNVIPSFNNPTIETMTLWERFQYLFYRYYIPFRIHQVGLPSHDFQKQRGIPLTATLDSVHTQHAMKLINNMFGLEAARPMGPLVQLVGPILRHQYFELTPDMMTFLDAHDRVAYIAFGQHAVPTEEDTTFLVTALYYLLEQGYLDGILWASGKHHPIPHFPSSGNTTKDILVTGWAPQFAILQHPSTGLFVTHGGAGSVHEGLFNKVPLFVYPFFGDQPLTARLVRQLQLGDYIDTSGMQYTDAVLTQLIERMQAVLTDHSIHKAVLHYGNAVQVRSLHAVHRGADLVEEAIFGAIDGTLPHLADVGDRLGWFKKYNIDLLMVVLVGFGVLWWIQRKLSGMVRVTRKMKTI
ncbi:hypothetical protein BCR42DRAFT_493329 [Absidia repens]|uniref:Uncharacterized protein n=1 Tax=Absidia repens TaxID=90262 RepID=A0A1X2IBG7_9FUNG|nr:hypothetical protein BCR42DRAFT_493329 [Absidia repens]